MTSVEPTPAAIRAAHARLDAAGAALANRPRARTLAALGALLDQWSEPDSAPRKQIEALLPAATGFHASTVREGLAVALEAFTGDALATLLESEQRAAPHATLAGFARTSVLLAGSIPMPTLTSLLFPLLLHSPVLAKTASRDTVTARVFAASLSDIDPELARCLEIVSFPSDDAACTDALLEASCVVATGSDATIRTIRAHVPATTRFIGYGHRLSLGLVGPEALKEKARTDVAARLARDVALWDQQGCLSPLAIFCEGDAADARALGEALFDALEDAERRWPRGTVASEAAAEIHRERDEASMRRADGRDVTVLATAGTQATVVVEDELRARAAPLHRFVRIHPSRDRAQIVRAIGLDGEHLAAVSLAGFGGASRDVANAMVRCGASRICAPGEMQAPPLGWHHDGQLLLAPLARLADLDDALD